MCTGRRFQSCGPAAANARSPRHELALYDWTLKIIRQSKLAVIWETLWSWVVQHLVHQVSELKFYSLSDWQPMELSYLTCKVKQLTVLYVVFTTWARSNSLTWSLRRSVWAACSASSAFSLFTSRLNADFVASSSRFTSDSLSSSDVLSQENKFFKLIKLI